MIYKQPLVKVEPKQFSTFGKVKQNNLQPLVKVEPKQFTTFGKVKQNNLQPLESKAKTI